MTHPATDSPKPAAGQSFATTVVRGILTALATLPLGVLYVLADGCYLVLYHLVRYRRRLTRRNLTRAYPDKTTHEIKDIERRFYRFFCSYVVETVKLLHISDDEIRRRMQFQGMDVVERLRADGKPLFVMLGHYGNWEYVTSITLWTQPGLDACQVYRPLSSKVMDSLMLDLRTRFRSFGIPHKEMLRVLLRRGGEGHQALLGLIADQRPPRKHHDVWTSFLRQPTAIVTGSERIGRRLDAHFIYADMEVTRRGHYVLTLKEMIPDPDDPYSISRQYMQLLEQTIDRAPQYYLWTHNRWKFRPDEQGKPVINEE